jgi:signal peptidase I
LALAILGAVTLTFVFVATIWMAVRRKDYLLKWYNRAWVYALVAIGWLALSFAPELFGATQKIETYTLASKGMFPTVRIGEYLVADQRQTAVAAITAGDVIVARYAHKDYMPFLHRVIGMPGDTVRLVNGVPEVNGVLLKQETIGPAAVDQIDALQDIIVRREFLPSGRSYLITFRADRASQSNTEAFEIGADEFFIVGDNRENSVDSRYPRPMGFGLVRRHEISGVVTGFYWSADFNRVGQPIDTADLQ